MIPIFQCRECLRVFHYGQLKEVKPEVTPLVPGEIVPYGMCPECGDFCHEFRAYTDAEILSLKSFAKGFLQGWIDRPGDEPIEDHWVTFSEGIDINFYRYETGILTALAYHRTALPGQSDMQDEVRLI